MRTPQEDYWNEIRLLIEYDSRLLQALPKPIQRFRSRWVKRIMQLGIDLQMPIFPPSLLTHQPTIKPSQE